jgi:phospholipid/cholesterol/gamma-HCH transport system permease protein
MHMRSEIDALETMGIAPVRFLIVPRLGAITLVGPALSLYAMFVGVFGGMVVAASTMSLPMVSFWQRVTERVDLGDFVHGLGKSLVFAWIIGLVGSHTGMRAGRDASAVGAAATRTVVTSVSLIVLVDAVVATATAIVRGP